MEIISSPSAPDTTHGEVLIRATDVGKIFCRDLKKSLFYGLCDMFSELLPFQEKKGLGEHLRELRLGEFWANHGITFEVRRGECLGLIGHNGAGKTTLLKMLNGLIKPDAGSIEIHGRVGAIIALGAGFNPILTGRENVYVNGSLLGLSKKELDLKVEEIIDFAEIREFIDSPVQSYSSGMQMRLGFAIATAIEPDILILDEVLAVGDVRFRTKCLMRISTLLEKAAVIFVSHSEEQLKRICNRGLLLEQGRVMSSGPVDECLDAYRLSSKILPIPETAYLNDSITDAEIICDHLSHRSGEDFLLKIKLFSKTDHKLSINVISIWDASGGSIAATDLTEFFNHVCLGDTSYEVCIKSLSLKPGQYRFFWEAVESKNAQTIIRKLFPFSITIYGSITHWSSYTPRAILHKDFS